LNFESFQQIENKNGREKGILIEGKNTNANAFLIFFG
jgi:hypothetical protein